MMTPVRNGNDQKNGSLLWQCQDMAMLSTSLALCERNHRSAVDSLHKGTIMWSVGAFFYVSINKLISEQTVQLPMTWDALTLKSMA